MFCRRCGFKLPDDSAFCPACGQSASAAPMPAPAEDRTVPTNSDRRPEGDFSYHEPVTPPPNDALAASSAVKVKRFPMKLVLLILAGLLIVAAAVFILLRFVFVKPGDAVVSALGKTITSESFKVDGEVVYDYEELYAFCHDVLEEDISDYPYEEDFKKHIEDKYGYIVDDWKTTGFAAVYGTGQDFVVYGQLAEIYQFRFDEDRIEYRFGNSYLEDYNIETEEGKEKNKGDYKDIYEIFCDRDIVKGLKNYDEADKNLKKYFAKHYDKAFEVLAELLNDTDAKYMKSYEKDGSTYTFTIDVLKFLNAVADNDTLKCTDRFEKDIDDLEEELDEHGIDDFLVKLSVTTSWGRLEKIEAAPIFDDYELGTATLRFYDYGDVSSDDLEIRDFDGDFDPFFTPLLIEEDEEDALYKANRQAKEVFYTIDQTISDYYSIDGYKYKRFGNKLSEFDQSDQLQRNVIDTLQLYFDEGETEADYYVYFKIDGGQSVSLVQIKGRNGIIGQYPNPAHSVKEAKELTLAPED